MMVTFSKYASDPKGPASLDAVHYMSAEKIPKPNGASIRHLIREPAPEILLGDPAMARAAIRISPGKLKYRSTVMSFEPSDIDVTRFNAGDREARGKVDLAVGLWCDIAFSGIPLECRPPLFATTHTHVGRLEVNLLIPRWVLRSDGALRSFNPDPPGAQSRSAWEAFEDMVNGRFDWADPRDPVRRRLVKIPDWRCKQRALAISQGEEWERDHRDHLSDELIAVAQNGGVKNRAEVLEWLTPKVTELGLTVHNVGPTHITIGPPNAHPQQRLRLKGLLFGEAFSSADVRTPGSSMPDSQMTARAIELSIAPKRLQSIWQKRAAFNASRYGLGAWPDLAFVAEDWLCKPIEHNQNLLPRQPLYRPSTETGDHPHAEAPRNPHPDGAPIAAPTTGNRTECADAIGRARAQDKPAGGRSTGPGSNDLQLEYNAQTLSGPLAPGRLFAILTARFRAVLPRLCARQTLTRVAQIVPDTLPKQLSHLNATMETLNAAIRHRTRLIFDTRQAPHGNPDNIDQLGHPAAPASGSSGDTQRRYQPSAGRSHGNARIDRFEPRDIGRRTDKVHASRNLGAGLDDHFEENRDPAAPSDRWYGRLEARPPEPQALAWGAAPDGSRAALMRSILKIGNTASGRASVSICRLSNEILPAASLTAKTARSGLETHVVKHGEEYWLLCGSARALDKAIALLEPNAGHSPVPRENRDDEGPSVDFF